MRILARVSTIMGLAVLSPLAAQAATVTFNFNSAAYTVGQYLQPSQVLTPEIGTGQTAQVSILNASNPNQAFQVVDSNISAFAASGKNISDAEGSADTIRLTFAHAIYSFGVTYSVIPGAAFPPPTNINPLAVSAYATSASATPLLTQLGFGDTYSSSHVFQYYGTLTLTSATAFTTVNLGLFNPNSVDVDTFAFDNIVADDTAPVPEPGAIAMMLALGAPAAWQLRKRKRAR